MDSKLINILCYKLAGDVSRAVHSEYENRWNEIKNIWKFPNNRFKILEKYSKTVQNLLAMSTFYRRVLSGMDGACDFYKTITKDVSGDNERTIAIGRYQFNKNEYNKLLAIRISFRKFHEKYGISKAFMEYTDTYEFLKNCKELHVNQYVKPATKASDPTPDEDLPF